MLAILEGADSAGKSTIAAEVCSQTHAELIHFGPPPVPERELDEVLGEPFATYHPASGSDLVVDRYHWGSPVYGPIYRPETDVDGYGGIGKAGWRYAELYVESRGGATFLVEASPQQMKERFIERGDDYAKLDDLEEIMARYNWLAADSLTLSGRINVEFTEDEVERHASWVIEEAMAKEERYAPLVNFKHYVGSIRPDTLIICKPDRDLRLKLVGELNDDWATYGIASTAMSPTLLDDLLLVLDDPKVVGLGLIPGHLENAIAKAPGEFVANVEELCALTNP